MATNAATETRGRGRPKSTASIRIENALTNEGRATVGFGGKTGTTEALARMRLYTAATRLGFRVRTTKVERGAVNYIEARVREDEPEAEAEAEPEAAPEPETATA